MSFVSQRAKYDLMCFIGNNLAYLCNKYDMPVHNVPLYDLFSCVHVSVISDEEFAIGSAVNDLVNCADGTMNIDIPILDSTDFIITQLTAD